MRRCTQGWVVGWVGYRMHARVCVCVYVKSIGCMRGCVGVVYERVCV